MKVPPAISWEGGQLRLLDQRRLPGAVEHLLIEDIPAAVEAIATLAVRGAPAIGIAAAYALAVAARRNGEAGLQAVLQDGGNALIAARPTAVNLRWAVERMRRRGAAEPAVKALIEEAEAIHREDAAACRAIGEHGRGLIQAGSNVLTHCNAGALAVSELGTATAPLYLNHQAGVDFHVYVDETRPLFQGARLTAWELACAGIDLTLICDSAAAGLMAAGRIDLIIVGADRVAANGDVVNKDRHSQPRRAGQPLRGALLRRLSPLHLRPRCRHRPGRTHRGAGRRGDTAGPRRRSARLQSRLRPHPGGLGDRHHHRARHRPPAVGRFPKPATSCATLAVSRKP